MPLFNTNLAQMVGQTRQHRPDASPVAVEAWLNSRIREVLDSRIYWADLLQRGLIAIPAAYSTGTVTVTAGSATLAGAATSWPVSDVVNTTLSAAVTDIGYVEDVTPAAMAGITADSLLYIGGTNAEVVPVVSVTGTTFAAKFVNTHSAGVAVTCSSLAGRQFRRTVGDPVFTIRGVVSATSLLLDNPWGGATAATQAYQIVKMYYTLGTDLKDVLVVWDPTYGRPLRLHVSQDELNWRDAQRTYSDQPQCLGDLGPNEIGNMQYEVWPCPQIVYQLPYIYTRQWPELVNPTDRPPSFINPSVFIHGAIADALRWKNRGKDEFHNPALAREFDGKFQIGLEGAKNADSARAQSTLQFMFQALGGPTGANYWQSHVDWDEL